MNALKAIVASSARFSDLSELAACAFAIVAAVVLELGSSFVRTEPSNDRARQRAKVRQGLDELGGRIEQLHASLEKLNENPTHS